MQSETNIVQHNGDVAEYFHVNIHENSLRDFIKEGTTVNEFLSSFQGYSGMGVFVLTLSELIIIFRWQSCRALENSMSRLLTDEVIKSWLRQCTVIKQQPAILHRFSSTLSQA